MIEEILANLYKIEIPLPGIPLKSLNSYIIKAPERDLIIDTGMDKEESMTAMQNALTRLHVDLRKTDFLITHLHLDHLGLALRLKTDSSRIFFSLLDAEQVGSPTEWDEMIQFALCHGFPKSELQNLLSCHPGYQFKQSRMQWRLDFDFLREGQWITVGDYLFEVIETPGHSKGHMCLYEPYQKILISGDHLLKEITPTIQSWSEKMDPLNEYLLSLNKIESLDIDLVLPGHGVIFRDCRNRILELKSHHQKRAEEILTLLKQGSQNAYHVASQMTWDADYDLWDSFPVLQRWFSTGEAIAHLKYLEKKGLIHREIRNDTVEFSLI
jgi:glyoxylase-like metal-dependent hydrolase (beta-lactamase superfamily II)